MADVLGVRPQAIKQAGHSPAIDQPAATARLLVDFFHDR
jgi:pimeloyl-ACP methyl ester carboxylesterase